MSVLSLNHRHPKTVVTIPARDEANHINACLDALAAQRLAECQKLEPNAFTVLLLVNNSSDSTAERALARAPTLPFQLCVREIDLPPCLAHAGGARGAVMDWGADLLGERGGVLCSTDADSEVSPTWIADIWSALDKGVDAVAGVVEFDPEDLRLRPFPRARRLEGHYAALQAEVTARLDPEPHNPWPNHLWAWGANMAVTCEAYRAMGGLPRQPLAEDRALIAALREKDFKVRHSLAVRVRTSRREVGRAPGGLADLVRSYACDDLHPCDAELEPILAAAERARSRRRLRLARRGDGEASLLARRLGLARSDVQAALAAPSFGVAWSRIEAAMPHLKRVRLRPDQLPLEIARAERLLERLRPADAGGQADSVRSALAGLWSTGALPA
jgi:hypothetical protein